MILTGSEIVKQMEIGNLVISPFSVDQINPNSYNLALDKTLGTYGKAARYGCKRSIDNPINMKQEESVYRFNIPSSGFILQPGILYLGRTVEKVGSDKFVPCINGRSSTGRLGIQIHQTAGWGDLGFFDQWTLEMSVIEPVKIYPNIKIAQVIFYDVRGDIKILYQGKYIQNCLKSRFFKEIEVGKKKGEKTDKKLN